MATSLLLPSCVRRDSWRLRQNPALRADSLSIPHEDHTNQVLGFVRQFYDNIVLTVVNLSEQNFVNYSYGVRTGGQWTQILCTHDAAFGGKTGTTRRWSA